jgi:ABC-2 type transport system permease protein
MSVLRTQLRREFWEHRALWSVPLVIAAVLLLLAASFGHLNVSFDDAPSPLQHAPATTLFQIGLIGWALPFYCAAAIQGTTYLLDCLYGERRDRSILFWRSMPVSDAQTVTAKLIVGSLLVPSLAYIGAALTSVLASGILAARNHGMVINMLRVPLWDTIGWLQIQALMLYGLVGAILWYAPFAAYLLLISAWAKRAPLAWALMLPVLLLILEHMAFGSYFVAHIAGGQFGDFLGSAFRIDQQTARSIGGAIVTRGAVVDDQLRFDLGLLDPARLLSSARLWLGLLATVLMTLAAIRLRRYRDEA